ncbi:glycerol dehydratase reactivase beta/small subunit family protein [Intestinibacter sp.]
MDNISRLASKKPQIKVYYNEEVQNIEYIKEVLFGIEEEGIPYQVEAMKSGSAVQIGYEASLESTLGVGIGIDKNDIVLHYNKLKQDSPIFKIKLTSKATQKRSLGANAARLVTRMPFKEIENLG